MSTDTPLKLARQLQGLGQSIEEIARRLTASAFADRHGRPFTPMEVAALLTRGPVKASEMASQGVGASGRASVRLSALSGQLAASAAAPPPSLEDDFQMVAVPRSAIAALLDNWEALTADEGVRAFRPAKNATSAVKVACYLVNRALGGVDRGFGG